MGCQDLKPISALAFPGTAANGVVPSTRCGYDLLDDAIIVTLPASVLPRNTAIGETKPPYRMGIPSHAGWLDGKGKK